MIEVVCFNAKTPNRTCGFSLCDLIDAAAESGVSIGAF